MVIIMMTAFFIFLTKCHAVVLVCTSGSWVGLLSHYSCANETTEADSIPQGNNLHMKMLNPFFRTRQLDSLLCELHLF